MSILEGLASLPLFNLRYRSVLTHHNHNRTHPSKMVQAADAAPAYSLESGAPAPALVSKTRSTSSAAPPDFSVFPTSFRINNRHTPALVSLDDLKHHLRLLGAFHDLRTQVQAGSDGITSALDPAARWSVFIAIAVYRFEKYITACVEPLGAAGRRPELPPLDVALVWHSYALNPRRVLDFVAA